MADADSEPPAFVARGHPNEKTKSIGCLGQAPTGQQNQPATGNRVKLFECPSVPFDHQLTFVPTGWTYSQRPATTDYFAVTRASTVPEVWQAVGLTFPGDPGYRGILRANQFSPLNSVADGLAEPGRPLRLKVPDAKLWTPDGPHFVDFDDARNGPAIQDLWMLLAGDRATMTRQLSDLIAL